MDKTHQTAVVIIPPKEVWEPIQAVRRQYDKQFRRWMPHITLLYPFAPKRAFKGVVADLAQVGWQQPPFELTVARFNSFRQGRSYTLWLEPEPKGVVAQLQSALYKALPTFDDTRSFKGGFTPHLSVGQVEGAERLKKLLGGLQGSWEPLRFTVSEIAVISRNTPPNDVFQVDQRISLEG